MIQSIVQTTTGIVVPVDPWVVAISDRGWHHMTSGLSG